MKIFVRFQKEWQRKEELYLKIIDYFEKGKQWEHALPLCKELAKVYEEKVFDFDKLSSVLRRQATLFDRVLSKSEENLRLDPEYFRVGFYGKGFPLFLRVSNCRFDQTLIREVLFPLLKKTSTLPIFLLKPKYSYGVPLLFHFH